MKFVQTVMANAKRKHWIAGGALIVARGAIVLEGDGAGAAARDSSSTVTTIAANSASSAPIGVTLLVSESEAGPIAFAAANGVLTLALAPPESVCCPTTGR